MRGRMRAAAVAAAAVLPGAAAASDAELVTKAEDAFGQTSGHEKIGIYTDADVRGFNPVKAGNTRVEGVYYDQVSSMGNRIRDSFAIRVGLAALDFPFPAPTGIVDTHLRTAGKSFAGEAGVVRFPYGGYGLELDLQVPFAGGRAPTPLGTTAEHQEYPDGASVDFWGTGAAPHVAVAGGEIIPFASYWTARNALARPVFTAPGAFVPDLPVQRRYFGQEWAESANNNGNMGLLARLPLSDAWSFRGGLVGSWSRRIENYSEVFVLERADGLGRHFIVADPRQLTRSISGEAQLAWRGRTGPVRHRLLLLARGRDRLTEAGGSDRRDLGPVLLGVPDPEPEPAFRFQAVDEGRIRQAAAAVGYTAHFGDRAQLSAGVQKARYRASFRRLSQVNATRQSPWLYNASAMARPIGRLAVYGAYIRDLEDSGVAPENAANRNEQLPASITTQMEAGFRLTFGRTRLTASAFQIEKPYFSFDADNRFTALGDVRHRGVEASVSTEVSGRLTLLGGAVLMDPVVTGEAREAGLTGERPVGTTKTLVRVDADYRTPIEGLSLNAALVYTGARTASARTYVETGGRQLAIPAITTVDFGGRYRFRAGDTPIAVRVLALNIFGERSWKIVAANSYQLNDARRVMIYVTADF